MIVSDLTPMFFLIQLDSFAYLILLLFVFQLKNRKKFRETTFVTCNVMLRSLLPCHAEKNTLPNDDGDSNEY